MLFSHRMLKLDGDLRPIFWFRSGYRVYCRARSPEIKAWKEGKLAGKQYNNLSGQNIGDEIWRDAIRNTVAGSKMRYVLEALWDVSKAFDRVKHDRLVQVAKEMGYPIDLLLPSLASYRWVRMLMVDKLV